MQPPADLMPMTGPRKPRRRRRIWLYILLTLALMPALLAVGVYLFQDKIIEAVVGQINTRMATPVEVGKIDLTVWRAFPQATVVFDDVVMYASAPEVSPFGDRAVLARLSQVSVSVRLWDILRGRTRLRRITLNDGTIDLERLADGRINYQILKPDSALTTTEGTPTRTAVDLDRIELSGVRVLYIDRYRAPALADKPRTSRPGSRSRVATPTSASLRADTTLPLVVDLTARRVVAKLSGRGGAQEGTKWFINLKGDIDHHRFRVDGQTLLTSMPVELATELTLEPDRALTLAPSKIRLGKAPLRIDGMLSLAPGEVANRYRINVEAEQSTIATLAVLAPPAVRQVLDEYHTKGAVWLKGKIVKEKVASRVPLIEVAFGCSQAAFWHEKSPVKLEGVDAKGQIYIPEGSTLEPSRIELDRLSGRAQGQPFTGSVRYARRQNPQLAGHFDGAMPFGLLAPMLADNQLYDPVGLIRANLDITAPATNTLSLDKMTINGTISLVDVGLKVGPRRLALAGWQGQLLVDGQNLSAQALGGRVGRSDLRLEGSLTGIWHLLGQARHPLGIRATLTSRRLDLDELLGATSDDMPEGNKPSTSPASSTPAQGDYLVQMAPHVHLEADCRIDQLTFRRLRTRGLVGRLTLAGGQARLEDVRFATAGGRFALEGVLDGRQPARQVLTGQFSCQRVRVDSLLWIGENFGQTMITPAQIRGQLEAHAQISLMLDQHLTIAPGSVAAQVDMTIREGELIRFEPMMALSRLFEQRELEHLRFEELTNQLTVKDRRVTIPEMDIRSNLLRVLVSGTHSFDQELDYRLQIPTASLKRTPIGAPLPEGGNLFLTLRGRPGSIKVAYDLARVRQKIAQDLKQEGRTLRDLFRKGSNQQRPAHRLQADYATDDAPLTPTARAHVSAGGTSIASPTPVVDPGRPRGVGALRERLLGGNKRQADGRDEGQSRRRPADSSGIFMDLD